MMLRRIRDARGSALNTSGGSTGISASEPCCIESFAARLFVQEFRMSFSWPGTRKYGPTCMPINL
jgi:hypothetical protein